MPPVYYLCTYIFPATAFYALWKGGISLLLIPFFTFVLVPLIELAAPTSKENRSPSAETQKVYGLLIYGMVPMQVGVVLWMLFLVSQGHFEGLGIAGAIATTGICCGAFGINIAHELGHRSGRAEQAVSKLLLLTSLYMHFFIEHNRGHHARVATADDPASSRDGETVYGFWLRSVSGGWLSAWEIEKRRLARRSLHWLTFRNQMLRLQLVQAAAVVSVLVFGGALATLCYVGSALVGILLLETVNYIEHYGLTRKKRPNGGFERVRPCHSWNSNHPIGRVLLFELCRHSDHHAHPGRCYSSLRHFDDSPQFPAGYPAMIVLALVPPLWFRVMDPRLRSELHRLAA
jgi:alkane 1-monooxygenase